MDTFSAALAPFLRRQFAALALSMWAIAAALLPSAASQTLDIGVYMSTTGSFAGGGQQSLDGVVTWARFVNAQYGGVALPNGTTVRVNLIIRDDGSDLARSRVIWQEFADMGLRYVIGGHTSMTIPASEFFEERSIVNVQCCTGPDAVYATNPKRWVLGIHRSSLDYPKGLLRQLSLRGVENVAIVYNNVSQFTITTADSAESFANVVGLNVVAKLEYDGAGYQNLTHGVGGPQLRAAIDQVAALIRSANGTRLALFGITLAGDGDDFARYVDQLQLGLEALFVTVAPTKETFPVTVGRRAAEYVYSPLQWHNSFRFDDPLFGTSAEFQRVFLEHHDYTATYTAASGTAAGVALHLGVESAGTLEPNAVMQALRELRRDTFFGPMAFNRYQRNYGGATGTIQILDGRLQSVLPDVSAEALSVLPMPQPATRARCPEALGHTNLTRCIDGLDAQLAAAQRAALAGDDDGNSKWVVAVAVVVPVVAIAAVAVTVTSLQAATAADGKARNVEHAPKDGRITLMFTDIQDSTKLWSTCPMSMSIALDTHHSVIREAINRHKCYEVKTAGDSFMIACPSEDAALALALAIQRDLLRQSYPSAINAVYNAAGDSEALYDVEDEPEHFDAATTNDDVAWHGLRVRIGFHSGTPQVQFDDVAKGYDYYGPPVNVAARVEAVAEGRQIACSAATAEYFTPAATGERPSFGTRSLGFVELRGVTGRVEVVEIIPAELIGKRTFRGAAHHHESSHASLEAAVAAEDEELEPFSSAAADGDRLEVVASTIATLLRGMRSAAREKTLRSLMESWRLTWQPGAPEANVAALSRRLASAYRRADAGTLARLHSDCCASDPDGDTKKCAGKYRGSLSGAASDNGTAAVTPQPLDDHPHAVVAPPQ